MRSTYAFKNNRMSEALSVLRIINNCCILFSFSLYKIFLEFFIVILKTLYDCAIFLYSLIKDLLKVKNIGQLQHLFYVPCQAITNDQSPYHSHAVPL